MGQAASSIYNYYYPPADSSSSSASSYPLLPDPIQERDILSHAAAKQVLQSLKERGYCIIKAEDNTRDLIKKCKEATGDFFLIDSEEKKKFMPAANPDPLLQGRRPNRGYVEGKSKEYLKIRMIDKDSAYPTQPAHLHEVFSTSMTSMHDICYHSLYCLGDVPLDNLENNENNKSGNMWLDVKATDNVKSFIPEGSSVSVIKYFQLNGEESNEDHEPLGEHVDTGIMTLIRISEVQGLQVLDQLHNEYLNLEELGNVGDLVLIMGRKIEFLLNIKAKLQPTLHKVVIPKNKERFSILFFMDLPGGKDT